MENRVEQIEKACLFLQDQINEQRERTDFWRFVIVVLYLAVLILMIWPVQATECAKQSEILVEYARFNRMEGGIPKGEKFLPNGSIVTLIVDESTKEWKILTVRPDTITCVLFEGMSWIKPVVKNQNP